MKAFRKLSHRGLVRVISFTVTLVMILSITAVTTFFTARHYRTEVEYTYQRALSDLSEYVNSLDVTLDKGQYATTPKQMQGLSTKLLQDSLSAKSALGQLPVSSNDLSSTSRFLSQVGNFCVSLSDRVSSGGSITKQELTTMDELTSYADSISTKLRKMVSDLQTGVLKIGEVSSTIKSNKDSQNSPSINSGFKDIESSFTNYPTMIYDGPFSDNILQQKPKLIQGKATVTSAKALQIAKDVTHDTALKQDTDTGGNLPCYNFSSDTVNVCITKAGGAVYYFMNSRTVGAAKLSNEQAIAAAEKALKGMGLTGFVYRYYNVNSGILTVNFAGTQNGVICYADLIKIGVALDNGSLVSYDAKGYVQNHITRTIGKISVTEKQARSTVSSRLSIQSHSIALIPSKGLTEVLCHEFICLGKNKERVLVYINAQTGMEEQILIIVQDDTGVLAM